MQKNVFIIAEAGVNHNGDLNLALDLVKAAAEAGADAIKFQTFKAETLVCRSAPKADYQKKTTSTDESQLEMIKKLELGRDAHYELKAYSEVNGIQFLSSPFDLDSIDFLMDLKLSLLKIPSGEITNYPYLKKIGSQKVPVIMSTGMSTLKEVGDALQVLVDSGALIEHITLLQCNTEYPTPMKDVNLRAMQTMSKAFPGVKVGYSDHTLGIEIPVAAVAMGATVIEKHFTLDKNLTGPDHQASLNAVELKAMVTAIRNVEMAMGNGVKAPGCSELKNLPIARKSLVTTRIVAIGEQFSENNLTVKRPGTGVSPMLWHEILGTVANRSYEEDELIEL